MIDDKTEFRLQLLEKIPAKLDDIHTAVTALSVQFQDGPGSWQSCRIHADKLAELAASQADINQRITKIEHRSLIWAGGLTVIVFLLTIYTPKIQHLLNIDSNQPIRNQPARITK